MFKFASLILILAASCAGILAQRPQRPQGPPNGGPPRIGMPPIGGEMRPDGDRRGDWLAGLDANRNGRFDNDELQAAIDRTFSELDRNKDGSIDQTESKFRPDGGRPERPEMGGRDTGKRLLPPFFFVENIQEANLTSKQDFEKYVRNVFSEMDRNADGAIDRFESQPARINGEKGEHPIRPNAQFIAAELRFGDKLVKDQPFSAEMRIEDTRRLFDGTTVTKKIDGAIYRDGSGRTRREQPVNVGGFGLVGSDNKPQMLIFINDFAARSQYFLDINQKVARRSPINATGPQELKSRPGATVENLGTREIEGLTVTGTRDTFEIPAGQLGNEKPIKVTTENWFSQELQMIVMSKHTDPLSGEHVFRLVNIRRTEPASDLFEVPTGFRIVGKPERE